MFFHFVGKSEQGYGEYRAWVWRVQSMGTESTEHTAVRLQNIPIITEHPERARSRVRARSFTRTRGLVIINRLFLRPCVMYMHRNNTGPFRWMSNALLYDASFAPPGRGSPRPLPGSLRSNDHGANWTRARRRSNCVTERNKTAHDSLGVSGSKQRTIAARDERRADVEKFASLIGVRIYRIHGCSTTTYMHTWPKHATAANPSKHCYIRIQVSVRLHLRNLSEKESPNSLRSGIIFFMVCSSRAPPNKKSSPKVNRRRDRATACTLGCRRDTVWEKNPSSSSTGCAYLLPLIQH